MKNRCILRKCTAILALTITTAFMLVACAKEPAVEEPTSITMITKASEVKISVAGAKGITIDWGDGEKSKTKDAIDENAYGLSFSHNYSGKSEHRITITGNIERLDCSNYPFTTSNLITTLDVSKNTTLKLLDCSNNQLTALDVSRNTDLRFLDCSNNPLTALDVRKNTALEELIFVGNHLTNLDVSRNTALKLLCCEDMPIKNLDVSTNTALILLIVSNTPITNLDISANTALRYLCCRHNQLTTSALNEMFKTLYYIPEREYGFIDHGGNLGTRDCDFSIATEKGWMYEPCRGDKKRIPYFSN